MSDQAQIRQARCPRWFRVLLGVSLALNLLVAGLAIGAALRFGGPDGMRPPPRSMATAMIRAMPQDHRAAMWTQTRSEDADNRASRAADTEAVGVALRAVPFDADALAAVLQAVGTRRAALQARIQQAWLTQVAQMSDAERADYADRLEHMLERAQMMRHHKD